MRTLLVVSVIALTVMCLELPALALWNIPCNPVEKPTFVIPQPAQSWTYALASSAPITGQVRAQMVSVPVAARGVWVDRTTVPVIKPGYIKPPEIARILNQQPLSGPDGLSMVPEPGSIAALSAGLLGLMFQVRRTKKRP